MTKIAKISVLANAKLSSDSYRFNRHIIIATVFTYSVQIILHSCLALKLG